MGGISFKDSLEKMTTANIAEPAVSSTANIEVETPSVMTLNEVNSEPIAAYSGDDGNWNQDSKYVYFNIFSDENISTINTEKDVILHNKQFNITQEENSQYVPFEMPRYYDGYDLTNAEISIHYNTSDGAHGSARPINVTYNDEKIRFAWLMDANATRVAGKLKFEVHAYGTVTGDDGTPLSYVWKSKSNGNLNVVQSLCDCKDVINNIDDSWMQELVTDIARNIAEEIKNVAVGEQVAAAESAATRAEVAAANAETVASTTVQDALVDYSTTSQMETYVAQQIADADIAGKLTEYAKTSDVSDQLKDYALAQDVYSKTDADAKVRAILTDGEYATKTDVADAIAAEDITTKLGNYYTKSEVDTALEEIDISEQLGDLGQNPDGSDRTVTQYVENKLQNVDLANYVTKEAHNSDIGSLNTSVSNINKKLESIDDSPRVTYEATYGDVELDDGSKQEYMFTLWETEGTNTPTVKSRFQIMGGGGNTSNVNLVIAYVEGYTSPLAVTTEDAAIIKYNFSGEDSAGDTNLDGVASWKVGNRVVATQDVSTGEREFDISEFVTIGDNKVVLTITHATGAVATKAWTIKVVDVRLTTTFDDSKKNPANEPVIFPFTPYGGVHKTVYFLLDGEEIGTKTSVSSAAGLSDSYTIPAQSHGSHLFEMYMVADVNGKDVPSNHIIKDIIWYDETAKEPVISCQKQKFIIRQYEAVNIDYTVYDPTTETPKVTLKATYINDDGEIVEEYNSTLTMSSNSDTWQYKTDVIGEHTLTITCGNTIKTLKATVTELGINISPITTGLVFDFNPVGYSNNDEDRLWSDGDISMSVSDNFDWINGGYQIDENGDQCFCIKAGTSAEINYPLFGDDAKSNGKEFKLIFRTENVSDAETSFLSCVSSVGEGKNIGIDMKAQEATIYAKEDSLPLPYAEEEIIEFEFNISASSEVPAMVMGYEDGVSTRPMVYDSTHDFQQRQDARVPISLGSNDCDLYIYRFKVYNRSLSDRDILNNFIADARDAEEMISRYDRNQIYKEGVLDPDYLAEVCPDLRIIKIECPRFTTDKSDYVGFTNIECIYKNGDPILDNWYATDAVISGQGTSSNNYGPSGRNLDLILRPFSKKGVSYNDNPKIFDGAGNEVDGIALSRTSIPVDYFNVKVNIASSENANNALLAKRYNTYNPYKRPFVREDESIIPYIKDTMEFYNTVIFVKETGVYKDGTAAPFTEFDNGGWNYYAFGNIGDSKKTDETRLTDPTDRYECILEVMDNTLPNSTMPTGKVDENGAPIYPIDLSEWCEGNSAYDSLHSDLFDEKSAKDKGEGATDDTYGWRYIWEDGSDEENAEVKAYVEQKWKDFYEFVVTSTDEEFKAQLGDWVVLDSIMYYYLFTLRYTLTDNHAKNSFFHYGKTDDLDTEGNPIRKWDLCFAYDMDTALGINNYGRMEYRYGYEEIDYVDGTSDWVWNAPQHVLFLRLRELFDEELCNLYTTLESKGAWSATSLINQFNEWQAQFPEELWRVDIVRKYIRTFTSSYINGEARPEFLKERANGRKKTQRAQFEKNQERYMSSKHGGTVASGDDIILRCSVPNKELAVEPNFDIRLTPYSYVYLNVKYNTAPPVKVRAVPGQEYTIEYTGDEADIIEIYSASCLQSIGDLSSCYLINGDFANARKIRELKLGSDIEGYNNSNEMTLGLGSNELLNKLDIQNMSGLSSSLDLSGLKNLKELYATGSKISGVIFADGGNIEIAEIPAVGSLLMKNLNYLTEDGMQVESYNSLTKLVAENSQLDLISILANSPNLYQVRLTGIDWALADTDLLERIYFLAGVNNAGDNTDHSVLSGKVTVPVIRQQQLYEYKERWPDLDITANTIIEQFAVTFVNDDDSVLEVQYVDKGSYAIDPTTRTDSPIPTPTKESTISTDFTFNGWDTDLSAIQIFGTRTVKAQYTETVRQYQIKYVAKGTTLPGYPKTGSYGENIPYEGPIPTYTLEEGGYTYCLFNRWDKSGFLNGDFDENGIKTVTAIFDEFTYTGNETFAGRELKDLSPVEIYALTKLTEPIDKELVDFGMEVEAGDDFSFTMGYDIDYDDINSEEVITQKTIYDGTTYLDTGIKLFDEDKDFVLALDYSMSSDNASGATLMQCFQSSGSNGFKLNYTTSPQFVWGSSSSTPASANNREMLVIRHKKGDNNLYIYNSNLSGDSVTTATIDKTTTTQSDTATLVLGAAKQDSGRFTNHAIGEINWCKIWYEDLGEDVCEKLVGWTHEEIRLEVSGFYRYQLYDDNTKETMMSLLATHLLANKRQYNTSGTSAGGWAACALNSFLNNRFYEAIPDQIRSLLKKMSVSSTIGQMSTDISSSGCYVTSPASADLDTNYTDSYRSEIYDANGTISYMINDDSRKRAFINGDYNSYWTRSPDIRYSSYIHNVTETGNVYSFVGANSKLGVLIEISF